VTTLEAVNLILRKSGSFPVASLDTDKSSLQSEAERCLDEEEKRIQTIGWWYNTRRDVTLTPDASTGHIALPDGVITIKPDTDDSWRNVTQVGDTLYDIDNNTDVFTSTLQVQYVLRYDFDCIPEPIALFIACRGALTYYENYPGAREMARMATIRMDADRAEGAAKRYNTRAAGYNVLQTIDARHVKGFRNARGRLFGTVGRLTN
jgi:hypothetical protein